MSAPFMPRNVARQRNPNPSPNPSPIRNSSPNPKPSPSPSPNPSRGVKRERPDGADASPSPNPNPNTKANPDPNPNPNPKLDEGNSSPNPNPKRRRPMGVAEALERLVKPLKSSKDDKFGKAVELFSRLASSEMTESNAAQFFDAVVPAFSVIEERRDAASGLRRSKEMALLNAFVTNSGLYDDDQKDAIRRWDLNVYTYVGLESDESFDFNKSLRKVRASFEALKPGAAAPPRARGAWCATLLKLLSKVQAAYTSRAFARENVESLLQTVKHNRQHFDEALRGDLDDLINELETKRTGLAAGPRLAIRRENSRAHPLRNKGNAIMR